MGRIMRRLSAADPLRGRSLLSDKMRTLAWCAEHGLPTAGALVTVQDGEVVNGSADGWPDTDLFSKLTRAYGGTGARRWTRVASGQWLASEGDGGPVDRDGLLAALRQQSCETGQPVLLQRALENHPDVAALTNGALATVRVVTLRALSGAISLFSATYRMPTGGAVIDAFSHGGMAAPVDTETGQLGPAGTLRMAATGVAADTHPDTGARITGVRLPDWDAVVALVLRAHAVVPGLVPLIGWDVALTADGPVLIEGNVPPSSALMQVPRRRPLGETPVVATILEYLDALP
ncbi:MAG TPA: sugar-transfer associated ATP-grasp domain-containing protein [Gemmatimonadaceae bacterium]|nr:sugar-transfer associated ATP-grasp domain-containing protein [Gemmatimonadaceae bacterium]